ncbi:MAG: isoprenylcysteine carboxylmethyltransferase family protein [Gammaproteobacteria bacterium]|nr:isoprenylcysteine carboxylmethyltransferase family protein [Gammaproteobacteria bacterium]
MKRLFFLSYGIASYLACLLTMAYSAAFFGNLLVSRTIDGVAVVPFDEALPVNLALLLIFALQHSGMARKSFRRFLSARLPGCLERSTYVLVSSAAIIAVMALWQPMGGVVWAVEHAVFSVLIYAVYFAGWALMLNASCLIDHFELFGVRQTWTYFRGGQCESQELQTPGLYRHVRHPIYLAWLLVLWASPIMTLTHLVFAAGATIYILVDIRLEERDLAAELPDYRQYQRKVPMLLPSWRKRLLPRSE